MEHGNQIRGLTVTSFHKQDVTLIARYGIENISAPAGVLYGHRNRQWEYRSTLPEGKLVTLHLKLATHKPIEWADHVARA